MEKRVLDYGDAEWERPPFAPPGGNGQDPDGGDFGDDGAASAGGFEDGGDGTGGDEPPWDETTGVPDTTTTDPTTDGSGTDDSGTTDASSTGDESSGTTASDSGDSGEPTTSGAGAPAPDEPQALAAPPAPAAAPMCSDSREPAVFYMSNDDSNSQASPILARQTILEGQVVDPFRVRVHEFLNYYDLSYENPTDRAAHVGLQMRRSNAEIGEFVLLAYAQGRAKEDRRPMNLVFSLDTSGSMDGEPIERVKDTMRAIAGRLDEGDVVSVVTWSTEQAVPLQSHAITGPADPTLMATIDALAAEGSTDLHGGLTTAYALAQADFSDDRINRVVLMSDGGANAGITELDIIANAADDSDGEGIYLVGVGVGEALSYRDDLMDAVTDAGKGAYVFIDSRAEADKMFGENFLANMDVAARAVRMELTMPWYFAITEFHGEEYSKVAEEIEPQHLSPNDAMSFHQIIQACDPRQIFTTDEVRAKITYEDPITREPLEEEIRMAIGDIVKQDASQLYKGDVVVAYAQSLIVIGNHKSQGDDVAAKKVATDMVDWLDAAATTLGDPEIEEMRDLMVQYAAAL